MRVFASFLVIFCTVLTSSATYRIWMDQSGHAIEAELKGVEGENIVLSTRDGKKFKVPPFKLSASDQSYLKGKIPDDLFDPSKSVSVLDREKDPTFRIKVNKTTDTIRTEWDWTEKDVVCKVDLTKASMQPYSRTMTATLYTIGRAKFDDYYVLLDKKNFKFDFNKSKDIEFSGDATRVRYYKSYNYGIEYDGYVVVVVDDKGKELAVEASSNKLEGSYQKLAQFKRDDVFSKSFEKKGVRSQHDFYY